MTVCTFDDCKRRAIGKGLCMTHYQQARRGGPLKPIRRKRSDHAEPAAMLAWILSVLKRLPDGCWQWQGDVNHGYGRVWWGGRCRFVHRLVLELHKGPPEEPNVYARHTCGNRACARPEHLYWGSHSEAASMR